MEHLETIVQQARTEYSDQDIVEQGADAQDLLAVIRSLMSDAKFRSVKDQQDKIDEIQTKMETIELMREKIPLMRKVKVLKSRIATNQEHMDCSASCKNEMDALSLVQDQSS